MAIGRAVGDFPRAAITILRSLSELIEYEYEYEYEKNPNPIQLGHFSDCLVIANQKRMIPPSAMFASVFELLLVLVLDRLLGHYHNALTARLADG